MILFQERMIWLNLEFQCKMILGTCKFSKYNCNQCKFLNQFKWCTEIQRYDLTELSTW